MGMWIDVFDAAPGLSGNWLHAQFFDELTPQGSQD